MMEVRLGVDHGSSATWSASFGRNRDGECFLVVWIDAGAGRIAVCTSYDRKTPPASEAELRAWAHEAIARLSAPWREG